MCHILRDSALKRQSGLLLKKLQHFVKDMTLFRTKSVPHAQRDIERLVRRYPREPAFQFSLTEMTYFKALAELLDPKDNYERNCMRQEATMDYLEHHICHETAQLVTPPKEFGFQFNWNVEGGATFDDFCNYDSACGDVQSESQWNFSNLGRPDRIQRVYDVLSNKNTESYSPSRPSAPASLPFSKPFTAPMLSSAPDGYSTQPVSIMGGQIVEPQIMKQA